MIKYYFLKSAFLNFSNFSPIHLSRMHLYLYEFLKCILVYTNKHFYDEQRSLSEKIFFVVFDFFCTEILEKPLGSVHFFGIFINRLVLVLLSLYIFLFPTGDCIQVFSFL